VRKCFECNNKATDVVRCEDEVLFLCAEHKDRFEFLLKEMEERVNNMTPQELEARLEELNGTVQVH